MWMERVAVFDLETTGVDPREARIVTAFIGLIDADGELERGTDWLADPGVEIPVGDPSGGSSQLGEGAGGAAGE